VATDGRKIVVGVSGASGAQLAIGFLRAALEAPELSGVHLVVSEQALRVAATELGEPVSSSAEYVEMLRLSPERRNALTLHDDQDVAVSIASGSFPTAGMVVIPCSAGTLASIAHGISRGLLQRAADVTLKERRPLVLAFRESPYSLIHIENMRTATLAGAIIMPPAPPFYIGSPTIERLMAAYYSRIARVFGVAFPEEFVWTGPPHGR
jgi:4-hydroxy-3-polyprenylbenzoate decarboxylase